MTGTWIALAALVVALATFIATQLRAQKSARADDVRGLEARVGKLEGELFVAHARIVELEDENLRLMRKLLANGLK